MKYSEEQQVDFDARSKLFGAAYDKLAKKHKCELVPIPFYNRVPNGQWVTAINLNIGDLKYKPVESPIAELLS